MTNSPNRISTTELIELIYDCAVAPEHWPATLDAIAECFACDTALIYSLSDPAVDVRMDAAASMSPMLNASLAAALAAGDCALTSQWPCFSRSGAANWALPVAETLAVPDGLIDCLVLFLTVRARPGKALVLARRRTDGTAIQIDLSFALLLLPHLRRAADINRRAKEHALAQARLVQSLDAINICILQVRSDLSIVHSNRTAQQMLQRRSPVRVCHGILRVEDATAGVALREAVCALTAPGTPKAPLDCLVRLDNDCSEVPVIAYIVPLHTSAALQAGSADAVASIFIAEPIQRSGWVQSFASTFRLTPAEVRVLEMILEGTTLVEAASKLGIAVSTARTHLRKIFQKSGVNRQPELVKLAATIAPTTFNTNPSVANA